MVVSLNKSDNMNQTEVVREKLKTLINDDVPQNDEVLNKNLAKRKDEVVNAREEVGKKADEVKGLPVRLGCLAPFVKKTFDIVEDPNTDSIVSWSFQRDSFVVWDPVMFSNTILPNYFKHNNFSTFVHQLNTYGFRKVYPDCWEFANEGFQGGKRHLLKNITRRRKYNKLDQVRGAKNSTNHVLQDEVERLKNDMNLLKLETLKLKQLNENTQILLTNVEDRVQSAESKQYQILTFLKIAKKSYVSNQLMQKMKQKKEFDQLEMAKKRRLIETNVDYEHQCSEQSDTLQSEFTGSLTASLSEIRANNCSDSGTSINNVSSLSSDYDVMLEKLMEESYVIDDEVDVHISNMYLELEGLISKPVDLFGSTSKIGGKN